MAVTKTTVATSDFISIKVSHPRTKLIQYSNAEDFAGIVYDMDPVPDFAIRVEAKFFKEAKPEENEKEENSDGSVVKLLGTMKRQKLIQVELSPYYLHMKLGYALQHNTIFIDNLAWVKEDSYEIGEQDEHSAFTLAEAWLTKKNNNYVTNPFS